MVRKLDIDYYHAKKTKTISQIQFNYAKYKRRLFCSSQTIKSLFSSLTRYGESQKLAGAVFTLAQKIAPCIIFIDEIDSFLRTRDSHDHEATAMVKAQFMQLWDGLETRPQGQAPVVVMGATNRPKDVDRAILRRMPSTFHIGFPTAQQRMSILKKILVIFSHNSNSLDYTYLQMFEIGTLLFTNKFILLTNKCSYINTLISPHEIKQLCGSQLRTDFTFKASISRVWPVRRPTTKWF